MSMHQNCPEKEEQQQEQKNFSVEKQHRNTLKIIFYYRRIYLESLDCIIDAMEDRFDQEDFNIHQTRKSLAESSQRRCLHPGLQ